MVFIPSIFHEYVNWDDGSNIYNNENLKQIDWQSIRNIFSLDKGNVIGNYNPLSILSFAIEKMLLGEFSPHVSHFVNLLLHLGTVFCVFRLLMLLGIKRGGAFVGAILFGIHPMRVESVAWATERKDVLFGLFFFASLIYYTRWIKSADKQPDWKAYLATLLFGLLAHLSKVQAVTLVLSMCLIDYWIGRKISTRWFLEKIPFALMALVIGFANLYTLSKVVPTSAEEAGNYTGLEHFLIGSYQYSTYLYKLVFPHPLSPLYPYSKSLPAIAYFTPLVLAGTLGAALWLFFKKNHREWMFGLGFFFFNVMFLLQWRTAGQGYLADRFTYVPYFGFFFIAAYWYDRLLEYQPRLNTKINAVVGVAAGIFAILSFQQIKIWENGASLGAMLLTLTEKPYRSLGAIVHSITATNWETMSKRSAITIRPSVSRLRAMNITLAAPEPIAIWQRLTNTGIKLPSL